ncbi:MAG TPA: GAF domain-containing sensor histidine kinase [Acidimicrobiales bacterium]|nr:GAF domain-containing sensor histidine kinase [Acidimicrobiales bacterium]
MDASLDANEFRAMAEEQAALRRVATLVARGATQQEVFSAVTEEVGKLLPVDFAILGRFEPDDTICAVASWSATSDAFPLGARWPLEGKNTVSIVYRTGRPVRIDDYGDASGAIGEQGRDRGYFSTAGAPIIVEGHLWGAMATGSTADHSVLPPDTERQLVSFTELVASSIANAESRRELGELIEEQAALRRVATLVAHGASPTDVFAALTEEVGKLLPVEYATLWQYEPVGEATYIASWGTVATSYRTGDRFSLGGKNLLTIVSETGRSARLDNYDEATGELGDLTPSSRHSRSAIATPIVVEAHLWGVIVAGSIGAHELPVGTEVRLAGFTELVGAAIANTESRAELVASRARIAAAADETRRQIERDLHDGTQQQLVSIILELRAAQSTTPELGQLQAQLVRVAHGLDDVVEELREISRGIHPALLSKAGLNSALKALGRRAAVPVELELRSEERLPAPVEVAAYYVASEALTNAVKHAKASVVSIELDVRGGVLSLVIRDDGVGGADPKLGSGLLGLADRVEALGGRLEISSTPRSGTSLMIEIPVDTRRAVMSADLWE